MLNINDSHTALSLFQAGTKRLGTVQGDSDPNHITSAPRHCSEKGENVRTVFYTFFETIQVILGQIKLRSPEPRGQ